MRAYLLAAVAIAATACLSASSFAQEPRPKGPPKTMGDEGKLPSTGTMSDRMPEMGGTGAGAGTGEPSGPKGPPKRMGDEGKLPATGAMSGATPRMSPPAGTPPAGTGE